MQIQVSSIIPNPDQPRTIFDEDELAGLAQSIRENGLIQPIVVEQLNDTYMLIDGERRWRAHQLAGLDVIEAVVRATSQNGDRLTHALVENVQRSQMGYVDEAHAYKKLLDTFGTLESVAEKTGVSVATISQRLTLLELSPEVQHHYNLKRLPFDTGVIAMFRRMHEADQNRMASMAVTRHWRTESILRAGRMILSGKRSGPKTKKVVEDAPVANGKFDAIAMLDKSVKLDPEIRATAKATCRACALYGEASANICDQCPLPDFLKRLSK